MRRRISRSSPSLTSPGGDLAVAEGTPPATYGGDPLPLPAAPSSLWSSPLRFSFSILPPVLLLHLSGFPPSSHITSSECLRQRNRLPPPPSSASSIARSWLALPKMDKRTKVVICAAAAYMLLSMMAMIIKSRKRKRRARRIGITYAPMDERDRMRLEYLNNKIRRDDTTCVNMLRLNRVFFQFSILFRDHGLLQDTVHMCIEQQVAMFLNTVGHNLRNRLVGTNFDRSGGTVGRYFNKVLHAIGELRGELIRPPSLDTPSKIAGNSRWDPYFKDWIGAIDGTHVRVSVPKELQHAFRGRKSYATQNVMAAVDFDLRFTYVLAGWEGIAHDALVLRDASERVSGLRVPQGKFYLVDAGYGAKPGFLPPFHGVRYHLNEWGANPVQNEKELFNLRHSSLNVTVERAFGALKRRFKILDDATPFFPFQLK